MEVALLDLKAQYRTIREEIRQAMDEVCDAQYFILGPNVEKFEKEAAAYCGAAGACGVTSGSDALLMALMAEEIGPGDEVITSPYSFFATVGAIVRVGATPVFADIDPVTFNIRADLVAAKITPRTKAVIPVHLFGQCCDMDPLLELAKKHKLCIIEDACQAIGSEYKGRRAGSMGDYGCFSFFPSKNLGCFGDGGLVTVRDAAKLEKLMLLRNHGMKPRYYHHLVGGNFRLDALQAVVLSVKLKYLDGWTAARQKNAAEYDAMFAKSAAAKQVIVPVTEKASTRHVYNQYCIRLPAAKRQAVWDGLKAAGVGCEVYYPVPLHLQPCFESLGCKRGDCPVSEAAAETSLALPIFPESTTEQRQYVVDTLAKLLA